jgi:sulfur-carrier protein adenylyltransferase/sulfurtransferase
MDRRVLNDILAKGILAPSADNRQPWLFSVNGGKVDLRLDPARCTGFASHGLRMPYVSAGAVIENCRVAAAERGYHFDVTYFPDTDKPYYVASLNFMPQPGLMHPHAAALRRRQTNRKLYRGGHFDTGTLQRVTVKAAEAGGRLYWIPKMDPRYKEVTALMARADAIRFSTPQLQDEFADLLVPSGEREGLEADLLGAPGPVIRILADPPLLRIMNRFGAACLFSLHTVRQMRSSAAAGLLVVPGTAPLDYIKGGEAMERAWHEMVLAGMEMQPMESLPIFALNVRAGHTLALRPSHVREVEKMDKKLCNLFGVDPDQALILLFRVGHALPPARHSSRRALESFFEESYESARV